MPIRPSERERYPADWRAISDRIKARAGYRCESVPGRPTCGAEHLQPHPITGALVVLTVAHLNHEPEDCRDENLRAVCQRCHNQYDQKHRQTNAARTRRERKQTGELFG